MPDPKWDAMRWMNPPASSKETERVLEVVTRAETDFWRSTGYGFVHDDGHFLGAPLIGSAEVELTFSGEFSAQYDQAGLMLRSSPELWLKAGVEFVDGEFFASAVVTVGSSDWSVAPLPGASLVEPISIRASRVGDSVTIRYGIGDGSPRSLLRLAYYPADAEVVAGPYCCSPTRGGLRVRFQPVRFGSPDAGEGEG